MNDRTNRGGEALFNRIIQPLASKLLTSLPLSVLEERMEHFLLQSLLTTTYIPDDAMIYGPFAGTDILKDQEKSYWSSLQCLEYMNEHFSYIGNLIKVLEKMTPPLRWRLVKHQLPGTHFDIVPTYVDKSLEFVKTNYKEELSTCDGILVVPFMLRREDVGHDNIRISRRDNYFITMIKLRKHWFLVQPSLTGHLLGDDGWYVTSK